MPKLVSFEELEAFYQERLERFARRMMFLSGGTREDAEDIYAESRLRAFRYFVNFKLVDDPLKVFWSWRCKITVNVWRDELRKRRCCQMVSMGSYFNNTNELDLPDPKVDIEGQISSEDERVCFWEKVESLLGDHKPVFWQCVKLRYLDDLEYEEIKRILNCPVGTIKSRLNRAIRFLRSSAISL